MCAQLGMLQGNLAARAGPHQHRAADGGVEVAGSDPCHLGREIEAGQQQASPDSPLVENSKLLGGSDCKVNHNSLYDDNIL